MRGPVVNVGIFLHASSQLGLMPQVPGRIWVLTLVVMVFSSAIALLKSLRDGSSIPGNLTATQGFQLVWCLLTLCYSGLIIAARFIPAIDANLLMVTHSLALGYFWYLSHRVKLVADASEAVGLSCKEYYQLIWKLFFVEYLIFPTVCLLA